MTTDATPNATPDAALGATVDAPTTAPPATVAAVATEPVAMPITRPDDYKVRLEVFEGPLDLLLYLIKKEELDITDINIEKITQQYLEYLELMRMLDLEIAGEFLVMAATLMYIKSRLLLPEDQRVADELEEGEDPRWELVRQLVEYKKFKDAAEELGVRELQRQNIYGRTPADPKLPVEPSLAMGEVSLFDLINAFNEVLKRANKRKDFLEIVDEHFTVADKIEFLLHRVAENAAIKFHELFTEAASRTEIVVTFLAVLELIRLKRIIVRQSQHFAEIEIVRAAL